MSIQVNQLTKQYGEQKAIDNISFSINTGEVVGFLGPNGAGKSTTMKIITGYLMPDSGTAIVAGIDVAKDQIGAKKKIGYLPESNPLYYDMYVREYLEFVAGIHKVEKSRIEEVMKMVGLMPERSKKAGQLSKGYKQRLGLAAALIHDPEVLVLDEPTTGLDPNQIIEIRDVIRELGKTKTILFSSHILQEVEAICDRVIIINKGQLIIDENLSQLQLSADKQLFVLVEYKENVDLSQVSAIPGVITAEQLSGNSFQIRTENPESVKRSLLEHSLSHNLNIVSLQTGERKLEEVFRELTGDKSNIGNR
jgi:ABC-2 type transport system ATP-binding protein